MTSPEVLKLINALPSERTASECVNPVLEFATGPLVVTGGVQAVVVVPPAELIVQVVVVVVEVDPTIVVQVSVVLEAVVTVVQPPAEPIPATKFPKMGASTIRVGSIPAPLVRFTCWIIPGLDGLAAVVR
jgi:hypothetical protein